MSDTKRSIAPSAIGLICGVLSSVLYTGTNVCLRQVSHVDAVWVSALKSAPTFLFVLPMICWLYRSGDRVFSSRRDVTWLVVTSFGVQIFGNVAFQWSLSVLGLAISVPMVLGTMLVAGATIGHLVLGEPVQRQKKIAVAVLILATVVLSYGAQGTHSHSTVAMAVNWKVGLALLGNMAAGIAYAFLGTIMRRSMQAGMPLVSTLFVLSTVGTTFLGGWAFVQVGWTEMRSTSLEDLSAMLLAGTLNAAAFFAMAKSLQHVPVLFVQMMNATQAAMAAAAGWLLFQESITASVGAGLLLTAAGLVVAGFRPYRRKIEPVSQKPKAAEAVTSLNTSQTSSDTPNESICG